MVRRTVATPSDVSKDSNIEQEKAPEQNLGDRMVDKAYDATHNLGMDGAKLIPVAGTALSAVGYVTGTMKTAKSLSRGEFKEAGKAFLNATTDGAATLAGVCTLGTGSSAVSGVKAAITGTKAVKAAGTAAKSTQAVAQTARTVSRVGRGIKEIGQTIGGEGESAGAVKSIATALSSAKRNGLI